MIRGIGTDLCEIARIEAAWEEFGEKFLRRVLTPAERKEEWTAARLARRWALKEAVAKAYGTGIGGELGFQQIEVAHGEAGAPVVTLRGVEGGFIVHASVSDDAGFALGFAVVEVE